MRTIKFFLIISVLSILIPFACKDENQVTNPTAEQDPGILRTNEQGIILGGDSTDWCWRGASNGFSFGPAYPNPVTGITVNIELVLPAPDMVKLYYLCSESDTVVLFNDSLEAAHHGFGISVQGNNFTTYERFYIECSSFISSDSCKNYGDIKFEE